MELIYFYMTEKKNIKIIIILYVKQIAIIKVMKQIVNNPYAIAK